METVTTLRRRCRNCGSNRFHVGIFVELDENGREIEQYREYRCPVCNSQYSADQLEVFQSGRGPGGHAVESHLYPGQANHPSFVTPE